MLLTPVSLISMYLMLVAVWLMQHDVVCVRQIFDRLVHVLPRKSVREWMPIKTTNPDLRKAN